MDKTLQPKQEESFYHKHKTKIFALGTVLGLGLGYYYSQKHKA